MTQWGNKFPCEHDDQKRLIGVGYPPIPPTIPPKEILATPRQICPQCNKTPVMPELAKMCDGLCWGCWRFNAGRLNDDLPF
jgi:hypothetical protein